MCQRIVFLIAARNGRIGYPWSFVRLMVISIKTSESAEYALYKTGFNTSLFTTRLIMLSVYMLLGIVAKQGDINQQALRNEQNEAR